MKIAIDWLKQYFPVSLNSDEIAEILTDTGLEVEGKEVFESVPGSLEGVVCGKIIQCEKHPNADRLSLTKVDVGAAEVLPIVCGAPNVAEGQFVLVAAVGTTLHTSSGESFVIKKSKIRGEVSEGMICAEDELGIGESHDGILVLDSEYTPGTPASAIISTFRDEVLEIGLTPNRSDAMSHYGVARDLRAALLRRSKKVPAIEQASTSGLTVNEKNFPIKISIEAPDACYRYAGISLEGVQIGPSPDWLQNRLRSIGLRPLNNVVDITNFVMHECGHPLHAFDADRIQGKSIIAKKAEEGQKFITLDNVERKLSAEDLMICDSEGPLVIAGVFGGERAEVHEKTRNIFLESALFDPVSVRKTARRHGLNTDASFRYERGVDPEMTIYALRRAAILIRDITGGKLAMDIEDVYPQPIEPKEVHLRISRVHALIGKEIPAHEIKEILSSLDIKIKAEIEDKLLLQVPAYRADVTREADLVEEVLRIYGFNNIPFGDKMKISISEENGRALHKIEQQISQTLVARGFTECLNNSLTAASLQLEADVKAVEILNPLSKELEVMRTRMLPGLVNNAAFNINRKNKDLRLFEWGSTYQKTPTGYVENRKLALLIGGKTPKESWVSPQRNVQFSDLKSHFTAVLDNMGIAEVEYKDISDNPYFEQAIEIICNNQPMGIAGRLHADFTLKMDVEEALFAAEFDWDEILRCTENNEVIYQSLSKFPAVRRDLALLIDRSVQYQDLQKVAFNQGIEGLTAITLFDVYEGKNLPEGKKSYALSFQMENPSKTMTDKQIEKIMEKLVRAFEGELGAEVRK